jgi:hypothetical protein
MSRGFDEMSIFETNTECGIRVPANLVGAARAYFHDRRIELAGPVRIGAIGQQLGQDSGLVTLSAVVHGEDREKKVMALQNVLNESREYIDRETGRGAI